MSKSEAIRQFLKKHPSATNTEVIEGLIEDNVAVTTNLINQVRHDYKHKKVRDSDEEDPLIKVKRLADELGGIDRLIDLASTLKKLLKEG